ncbi:MAG TPA: YjcZ family sporulation protein [Bacillota bacterium]|nr:YjcZ family sporulation protein [Bacillota bacterium]
MSDSGAYGGYGNGFALIVVLFILLIIVGTAYVGWC